MKYVGCTGLLLAAIGLLDLVVQAQDQATDGKGAVIVNAAEYPSLQAAVDALPETGGLVQIPPGLYELRAPLRITKPDVHLKGAGTSTHIRNLSDNGDPAIVIEHPDRSDNRRARLWRVELSELRITGTPKSGPGILANGVNELFVHDLTLSYHGSDGIRMIDCYEDPRISDCLITYNKGSGLRIEGGHDIVVSANQFEENLDAVQCIDSYNLCMTGNNLDDHLRHGVVIENTYGSIVSANMIEECQGAAVVLDRDCYGITISGNVIAHESGGGVLLLDAHGCTVSANTFTIVKERALYIGPHSGRITVTGNNFSNSFIGDGQKRAPGDQEAAGIVLENAANIVIVGNVFSGLTTKAIELRGKPSKGVVVQSNAFVDCKTDLNNGDAAPDGH